MSVLKDFYEEYNNKINELIVENIILKSYLQEIKGAVTSLQMNNWLQMNETVRKSIELLQELITKAEEE